MVKVKINGKLYKKKVGKSSGSPSIKIFTGKHATGSTIHVYIYNSYNQKLCYSKDKVYFGKTLYVGMTSKQALQTTWGKPTDRYSYPGYQVWIFQSGDTVVFAYISGGRVIKLASPIY